MSLDNMLYLRKNELTYIFSSTYIFNEIKVLKIYKKC